MKRLFMFPGFLLVLVLSISAFAPAQEGDAGARKLYQKGLEQALAKEWNDAGQSFRQLIADYPESEYLDDAYFWVGHCLEHTAGDPGRVYDAYQDLSDRFPESSWVNNAVIQQIGLAEQLVRKGQESYHSFLLAKLQDSEPAVNAQAALALGRLGDQRAVPVLRRLTNDPENSAESLVLLTKIAPDVVELETGVDTTQLHLRSDSSSSKPIPRAKIPLFSGLTREHRTYTAMLKTTDNWNQQELIDFAMWYILTPKQFQHYYALGDEEKRGWIVENWKDADPNPRTQVNEALQEFERRVQFAREHFAGFWNDKMTNYLPEQYQREGWANAPWDARGEIYIKYGAPDFETLGDGFNEVEWTYYRYNVDFVIHKYMTNIYGNAISLGYLAYNMYAYDFNNMSYHFIEEKQFVYP